jgi:hypothetical protein
MCGPFLLPHTTVYTLTSNNTLGSGYGWLLPENGPKVKITRKAL